MRSEEIEISTGSDEVVHDLTSAVERFLEDVEGDGLLHVWVPHATAGLAILETGAGSDDDLLTCLLPPYATVPVLGGVPVLGTWQSICLVDTNIDNPVRRVRFSFLAG